MLKPFDSATYQRNTARGTPDEACCLCGKPTLSQDGAIHVPVNHETGQFVTDAEVAAMGDEGMGTRVSLYPIGPDCVKRWAKEFPQTTRNRFRRSGGKLISYDARTTA